MVTVNESDQRASPDSQGSSHVDRLNALWKLSAQGGLSDPERIHAMLGMAAQVLDMDLFVLGEFGEHYIARYVSDRWPPWSDGVLTVAEHVEDVETARMLTDMGVDYGQGWYFGRPQLAGS